MSTSMNMTVQYLDVGITVHVIESKYHEHTADINFTGREVAHDQPCREWHRLILWTRFVSVFP